MGFQPLGIELPRAGDHPPLCIAALRTRPPRRPATRRARPGCCGRHPRPRARSCARPQPGHDRAFAVSGDRELDPFDGRRRSVRWPAERVARDDRVADPVALLLVVDGRRVAVAHAIGALAGGFPAELAAPVRVGEPLGLGREERRLVGSRLGRRLRRRQGREAGRLVDSRRPASAGEHDHRHGDRRHRRGRGAGPREAREPARPRGRPLGRDRVAEGGRDRSLDRMQGGDRAPLAVHLPAQLRRRGDARLDRPRRRSERAPSASAVMSRRSRSLRLSWGSRGMGTPLTGTLTGAGSFPRPRSRAGRSCTPE